jgi:hypothetical protein
VDALDVIIAYGSGGEGSQVERADKAGFTDRPTDLRCVNDIMAFVHAK